jgi:hypothetical protein
MSDQSKCNICSCDFSLDGEGGIDGHIGMLYFSLCPTCFSGIVDMCDQLREDDMDVTNYEAKPGDEDSFSNLD